MFRKFFHFSTTLDWLETKAEYSKWSLYRERDDLYHLFIKVPRLISLHWFSYLEKNNLEKRIINIIRNKRNYFINLVVIKLINNNLDPHKEKDLKLIYHYQNKNIFFTKAKSAIESNLENFIIDLKEYNENYLTKNWKRNLKRSEKKASIFSYKFLDASQNIDEIYSLIIKNSQFKKYKYPYSKKFLKRIIDKSKSNIVSIGAYDQKSNLIAIRSYYQVKNTAIDFIAAALPLALKYYVTYSLAYKLIQNAKDKGNQIYNLGGVNFKMNKGVYNFKKGLGGELKSDGVLIVGIVINKYIPKFISLFLIKIFAKFI